MELSTARMAVSVPAKMPSMMLRDPVHISHCTSLSNHPNSVSSTAHTLRNVHGTVLILSKQLILGAQGSLRCQNIEQLCFLASLTSDWVMLFLSFYSRRLGASI